MYPRLGSMPSVRQRLAPPRRHAFGAAVAITAGLCTLSFGVAAVGAATPGQTTFKLTGTVSGTLTEPTTACSMQVVTAKGATFILSGTLKGAPASKWTIQLYNPKAGTSKNLGEESGNGPSVTLIGEDANGNENWNWTSETKNGSITTSKTSGKVSTTLGPYSSFRGKAGKGHVHVTGSWGCTS